MRVLLTHKEPDSHISVNIEFGEGRGKLSLKEMEKRVEVRKPKEKVTYKMMQQYIEEHYGFKVHTAYIAEVKRGLGLPMHDASHAVEELKHPRPHPTERMVTASKETLAHFNFNTNEILLYLLCRLRYSFGKLFVYFLNTWEKWLWEEKPRYALMAVMGLSV